MNKTRKIVYESNRFALFVDYKTCGIQGISVQRGCLRTVVDKLEYYQKIFQGR